MGTVWMLLVALARAETLAILHATVLPVSGPPIADGTVVVTDGHIAGAGARLSVPAGASTVDSPGMFLMPGIVDILSHLGVFPWPDANAYSDGNEAVEAFTPRVWAGDSFDPED